MRITDVEVVDVRFPTALARHGSDAMNRDPDYSAAYVCLETDDPDVPVGHGLAFTIGRGTEIVCAAVRALAPSVVGLDLDVGVDATRVLARRLAADSQLRWIGPEKGPVQLAASAVLNAVWDLLARRLGLPLWEMLARLTPEELVDLVDFRYLSDEITPASALELLVGRRAGLEDRVDALREAGLAAYTTTPGWLGYDDATVRARCARAVDDGFRNVKIKVGADLDSDLSRAELVRAAIGPDRGLLLDANQVWDVSEAITAIRELARVEPGWIEEPTHPDDVAGHRAIARAVAPIAVASGEMVSSRVVFKQFLQAGAMGVCQLDACRLMGVNEALAVLLMCAARDVPVCPHAGGLGLNEYVTHLAAFDQIAVSATGAGRMVEHVDHCSEHLENPATVIAGRYLLPVAPGYGAVIRPESVAAHRFPDGASWAR